MGVVFLSVMAIAHNLEVHGDSKPALSMPDSTASVYLASLRGQTLSEPLQLISNLALRHQVPLHHCIVPLLCFAYRASHYQIIFSCSWRWPSPGDIKNSKDVVSSIKCKSQQNASNWSSNVPDSPHGAHATLCIYFHTTLLTITSQ